MLKEFDFYKDKFVDEIKDVSEYEPLTENALELLRKRYFIKMFDKSGNIIFEETEFSQLVRRISRCLASAETLYTKDVERIRKLEKNIFNDMMLHRFIFNSPALFNLGKGSCNDSNKMEMHYLIYDVPIKNMKLEDYIKIFKDKNVRQMCFACFVVPVTDSLDSIMDSVKKAAVISKSGGGVGAQFGNTREKGSTVHGGMGGIASGPLSWIKLWNAMGDAVVQGGQRRAAFMAMLYDNHPDIFEFIHAKDEDNELSRFNLSVALSNKVMNSVIEKDGKSMDFVSKHTGKRVDKIFIANDKNGKPVYVTNISTDAFFNEICNHAWLRGDPGIFFIDKVNDDNILKMDKKWKIESTNPCGEQPLPNSTCCNLGSINLNAFIDETNLNIKEFADQVYRSMYYLDLILDASSFPLNEIEENSLAIRPVGLGLMGIADVAYRMNISYISPVFKSVVNVIASTLAVCALDATVKLADIKPEFKESHLVKKLFESNGLYAENVKSVDANLINSFSEKQIPLTLTMTFNVLKLLKNFSDNLTTDEEVDEYVLNIVKNVMNGHMRNSRRLSIAPTGSTSMIYDANSGIEPIFQLNWNRKVFNSTNGKEYDEMTYFYHYMTDEEKNKISNGEKLTDEKYLTANEISVKDHLEIMSIFARYIDSAISKTINFKNDATVEDVKEAYIKAYLTGCKGLTIYRDGSRNNQPIVKKEKEIKNDEENKITATSKKERPHFLKGITESVKSDLYGTIYVTVNFDEETSQVFEVFVNVGKSGAEVNSLTSALARAWSIALRSGASIRDLIKTSIGICSTSEAMTFYETVEGKEIVMTSIPDAVAKLILQILNNVEKINGKHLINEEEIVNKVENYEVKTDKICCPECGSTQFPFVNGCRVCLSCGFSRCSLNN